MTNALVYPSLFRQIAHLSLRARATDSGDPELGRNKAIGIPDIPDSSTG